MNILLINHYAGTPELGMEFRPYYMAKEWVKQGHNVLIVGGSFSHLRKKQPVQSKECIDGINYRWIKLNEYKGNGIGRIISMFSFVSKLYFCGSKYLDGFKPDIVIASSTYPLDIYPAHKIAKKYNAKLVYEVHDLWPLSPMEIGGYSKYHPFIWVMQQAENYAYKHCDKVVSLLPNALEHMKEHGLQEHKFVYIPNGFDISEWDNCIPLSRTHAEVIQKLHNEGKFVLGYAGGHAKSNALDYLLDAMKLMQNDKIVCVLVGKGQEKQRLMERSEKEGIDNVMFLDAIPKKEIPALLKSMDALFIGWEKNPLYRFGISPNKLIDYMMAEKPIIHSVNAANDWVKEKNCGISVKAEDVFSIAAAIQDMATWNIDKRSNAGFNGKNFVINKLPYPVLAKEFIESIK